MNVHEVGMGKIMILMDKHSYLLFQRKQRPKALFDRLNRVLAGWSVRSLFDDLILALSRLFDELPLLLAGLT